MILITCFVARDECLRGIHFSRAHTRERWVSKHTAPMKLKRILCVLRSTQLVFSSILISVIRFPRLHITASRCGMLSASKCVKGSANPTGFDVAARKEHEVISVIVRRDYISYCKSRGTKGKESSSSASDVLTTTMR